MIKRCAWADSTPLMARYHDTEWGVPVHDDGMLFELLTLEGAQAGLSWSYDPQQAGQLSRCVCELRRP